MNVRTYRAEDLPWILQRSTETSWAQLVGRDQAVATADAVRSQVWQMYQRALQTPAATIFVVEWPPEIAEAVAGPAAYALVMPQANPFTAAGELVVLDIYTDPRLRGRRLGRSLLQQAEAYARAQGLRGVVAQVAVHNRASFQMFSGAGFLSERVVMGRPC